MLNVEITSALVDNPRERQGDVVRFYESSYPGLVSIYAPGKGARLTRESVETLRDALSAHLEQTAGLPFAEGMPVVVTGDTAGRWGHDLPAGTPVVVESVDSSDDSLLVRPAVGESVWIAQEDVAFALDLTPGPEDVEPLAAWEIALLAPAPAVEPTPDARTFEPGDRVVYVGESSEWVDASRLGTLGTVETMTRAGMVRVRFEQSDAASGVYPGNLRAYSPVGYGSTVAEGTRVVVLDPSGDEDNAVRGSLGSVVDDEGDLLHVLQDGGKPCVMLRSRFGLLG